jgi:PKD repeat protein
LILQYLSSCILRFCSCLLEVKFETMKYHFTLCILISMTIETAVSQVPGEWVWIHGDSTTNGPGTYGIQGIPDPFNCPAAVYEPAEWQDAAGNFWLFGGEVMLNHYTDVWKYEQTTNEWTWIKGPGVPNDPGFYGTLGVSSPFNSPPYRGYGSASWVDVNGDFWLFGGRIGGGGFYNDLWKYDPTINEWTWMKGSNILNQTGVYGTLGIPDPMNHPGARSEVVAAWADNSGNLWMFGGYDNNGQGFNDLWRYNIVNNEWTWMKGSQSTNQPDIYGMKGIEGVNNTPGARQAYAHWYSNDNFMWLFGGGASFNGNKNDLWRYNPLTNNWTWISGTNILNSPGSYGTKCIADSSNVPPSRFENRACWYDKNGNFWFFGGTASTYYNDLWKYCRAENIWIWVSGSNTNNTAGNWGTKGVSSPTNIPNGRMGSVGWQNKDSMQLYLFGGDVVARNDLWKFTIDTTCAVCSSVLSAAFSAPNNICPGTCISFSNLSQNGTSFNWTFPGAIPSISTDVNPSNICYANPGNYDVTLIAINSTGTDTLTLSNYITVYPQPLPQGILQSGDTLFANAGAVSYQWFYNGNTIPGATNYFYIAQASGDYNVVATDENGCEVEAVINNVVAGSSQLAISSWQLAIFPNPVVDKFTIQKSEVTSGTAIEVWVYSVLGEKILLEVDLETMTVNCRPLKPGIYFLELSTDKKSYRSKFIKE